MGTPDKADWPEDVAVPWTSFHRREGVLDKLVPEICDLGRDLLKVESPPPADRLQRSPGQWLTGRRGELKYVSWADLDGAVGQS